MATPDEPADLLLVGFSVRAAAQSAVRAGLRPLALDACGDADTLALCAGRAVRVVDYPAGLVSAAATWPDLPLLFTGAIENEPALLERLAGGRPLLGPTPDALRTIRSPERLVAVARAVGLPVAELVRDPDGLPIDGSWLLKRDRSAGGTHIEPWRGQPRPVARHYFQRRLAGPSLGLAFVTGGGRTWFLGLVVHLPAARHAPGPFAFSGAGSGPTPELLHQLGLERAPCERIGQIIATEMPVVGLWGLDVICTDYGLVPLEINPRFTAGMELLERQRPLPGVGPSLVGLHRTACCDPLSLPAALVAWESTPEATSWSEKRIVYAGRPHAITPARAERLFARRGSSAHPRLADLPAAEQTIPAGAPVLTRFVDRAE